MTDSSAVALRSPVAVLSPDPDAVHPAGPAARAVATRHDLPGATRAAAVALPGGYLVEAIALEHHAKQPHWNVKGMHFRALHARFDDVAAEVEG